jgi:hypothetical protein
MSSLAFLVTELQVSIEYQPITLLNQRIISSTSLWPAKRDDDIQKFARFHRLFKHVEVKLISMVRLQRSRWRYYGPHLSRQQRV